MKLPVEISDGDMKRLSTMASSMNMSVNELAESLMSYALSLRLGQSVVDKRGSFPFSTYHVKKNIPPESVHTTETATKENTSSHSTSPKIRLDR